MAAPFGNKNAVKNRPLADLIRRSLAENDWQRARQLVDAMIDRAIAESDNAAAQVLDRVDGKVPQAITGVDGGPLQVQDVPWLEGRKIAKRQ